MSQEGFVIRDKALFGLLPSRKHVSLFPFPVIGRRQSLGDAQRGLLDRSGGNAEGTQPAKGWQVAAPRTLVSLIWWPTNNFRCKIRWAQSLDHREGKKSPIENLFSIAGINDNSPIGLLILRKIKHRPSFLYLVI
jgi:hypothetical protein